MTSRNPKRNRPTQGEASDPQYPQYTLSVFADLLPRDRHPHLVFVPQHYHYHEYNEALYKIHQKECEYPRVIDWTPLDAIDYSSKVRKVLTQSMRHGGEVFDVHDLERLIAIQEPIYEELVMEFLATLEMYIVSSIDETFLRFKLGGAPRKLSLRQIAASLGIYTDEEYESDWFEKYIMTGARLDEGECNAQVWARFSDRPYLAGKNLVSTLKSPKYNVVQKLLAHTLTLRGSNKEKVTLLDLWFLDKLKSKDRINLPYAVGKFLHVYASGNKPKSKLCGGHFITRFAKSLGINLKPRNPPYTLVENPGLSVGRELYSSAGILRLQGGKYIPITTGASSSRTAVPRAGSRGKRPASRQEDVVEEEDEEEEEAEDEPMDDTQGQHSQSQEPPYWQGFMYDFNNLRLELTNLRDQSRYETGAIRYQNDWLIHNHERMSHRVPDYEPTPYHHPPYWGEPGGVLPAPVYDRDASLIELQRHQEHMQTSDYHQQQQTWGTSWSTPEPSNWQQNALHDWLFQPPQQQPPHDHSPDQHHGGSF